MYKKQHLAILLSALLFIGCKNNTQRSLTEIELGEKLFHDTTLSKDQTMSCATCHDAEHAFIDSRPTNLSLGASLGDDLTSIGDRNAPTASYASFIPKFHFDDAEGLFIGGQFLDGRATDLKTQAKGPFLNPVEMNMPDEASVITRVQENPEYVSAFKSIYGEGIFDNTQEAYDAVSEAIANFEKTEAFAPFDSKFDKMLKGEATFTDQEARGLALFNGKAQCVLCHVSEGDKAQFTDFSYDNLGVPVNHPLRDANHKGTDFVDNGLFENVEVNDEGLKGAFRVSTLRNIAVTGPYMHNGVFSNLKTVVHFYNTRDVNDSLNPETGAAWGAGEVAVNQNTEELGNLGLTHEEEEDIVAFLETLTDEKYEHLIP